MGELTFFLGLQVEQRADGIFLSQDKYVYDILKKFGYSSVKTASTPMETHKPLTKDENGSDVDVHLYRSMIGSLMYLTSSRPDIMFAVCACSRFQVQPKASHMHALIAYSDSDYASASLDRKSTTGGCQFLGCRLVSWQCKKQSIMANSTTEAEYIAASNCYAQNPVSHSKTKYIEIRYHFIRDCYEKRLIEMAKIHTDNNVADLLTNAFDVTRFKYLIASIELIMANLKYCDKHNMVAFLKKPTKSEGFTEIVDFLKGSSLSKLQLADVIGINNVPDAEIYEGLITLGNRAYNFSKLIFDGMVHNIESTSKFLMYPRFLQMILDITTANNGNYLAKTLTKKLFANIKRGYARDHVPLLPAMLAGTAPDQDEATTTRVEVNTEGATTTTSGLDAGLDSGNIHESPLRSNDTPLHEVPTSESVEDSMKLQELSLLVPKLEKKINSLENKLKETKQTLGSAILTLVKKVKSLEVALKRKSKKVVVSDSEEEETEAQERKIQELDGDPLVSLVEDFVTPTKTTVSTSGEEQVEDISPTTLEAAKTLSKVASQAKSTDKGRREDINIGKVGINTGSEGVSTGSLGLSTGKAPMTEEEIQATKRTKAQIQQEEAGLAEAIRLQTLQEEEAARQGESVTGEDFAKMMVEMINEKKKSYAEQKVKIVSTDNVYLSTVHNLWDIIINGDLEEDPVPTGDQSGPSAPVVPKTAKQLATRRNQERVKSILLLAIPDEYLLKFHNVPDAKSLWEAIKSRFGGNEESKKMQKNVLKHQFENFTTAPNESLDKAYDRFQRLISQLEVYGAVVTKEDINEKFLRSLPPAWSQIALYMRNKADIDKVDTYDLYNNLKVYEDEMNKSSSSSSTSQNLAFLSSENTSSTNKVSTASREFGVNSAGGTSQVSTALCVHEVACLFFAQPTTSPQLKNEDFQTGRNMDFKEKRPVSLDKSKVECYNCHKKGHFGRECRSGRNQGRRSNGDNGRSNTPTNESSSQALVAQDGLGGYDWSNDFEIESVNYALMAFSSSNSSGSSDKEVKNCSKQCVESFKSIQTNYDSDREKYNRARLEIQGYEIVLESLKARILGHEKNELAWGEKYEFQNYELKCREIKLDNLKLELEKVIKERDELKLKTTKWEASSKHLNKLLNSQMSTRDKTGLGYGTQINELSSNSETDSEISLSVFDVRSSDEETTNNMSSKVDGFHAVPPPITGNFLTLRTDISFAGLDEFAIKRKVIESQTTEINTDTSKTKTSENLGNEKKVNAEKPKSINESVVSKLNVNKEKVIIEDWTSDDEDEVSAVQTVCHVKSRETQTVRTKADKISQVSQKSGIGFKKVKACFVCKSTDHLIKDCNFYDKKSPEPKLRNVVNTGQRVVKPVWDNANRVNHQKISNKLKYPQAKRTFVPSGVLTRIGVVSTGRPKVNPAKPGNPEILLQDHAVVDSGCSSHMTGNKAYLSDYEDYNGGFVAFGSDPKGGKITGKGKIKTANLDFDDVYFVDELKFNLFSVSQMCDKKNSVLFTESEFLILSPSFKLIDESQVVLRAPRKDDVYNLDLKNIVLSGGITCLYANATLDESKLWHRRLGHVNYKNINKLVKGNLVRGLPSKVFMNDHTCVACKKGKQHKASCKAKLERTIRKPLELLHMDLFGPISVDSINKKRYRLVVTDDFSRFKRKNRTLIEAARTMLADSLLPIPFWAEVVNTACYVLNRVLVTKPQNKTPYELLMGKSPSISFMRPFGCSLTILKTLDSLGKFDGKSDEGYLLGYSTTSKAFRVYNKRTKRVEENLHIDFLEDKPNVAGTGPDCIFDLDFLTNTMNYIPVSVENQVLVDTGTQESYVAGSSGIDKRSPQEYILIPVHSHKTRSIGEDVVQDAHEKPSKNVSKDKNVQDSEDGADKEEQY
ncbi:ribonuclease H-like domain-containing protein [Tanacetum coccineum]